MSLFSNFRSFTSYGPIGSYPKFCPQLYSKDKRERSLFLLNSENKRQKFTDKLNHNWDDLLDTLPLVSLDKDRAGYLQVKSLLHISDNDPCYIISDDDSDNTFLPFRDAFKKVDEASFGSLLININASKLFLKPEVVQGHTPRYIGIK
ncbi:hypothetical protein GCM10023093_14350 [Nemorincola caseinilytica]|uniref:Uncharacterized protein n=1 Tax=Nemorincola caseinilytica TaxID=2054315 RepID=A0ABP8NE39_9BACT